MLANIVFNQHARYHNPICSMVAESLSLHPTLPASFTKQIAATNASHSVLDTDEKSSGGPILKPLSSNISFAGEARW